MTRYVIRRLLWGVLMLLVVAALTFVIFRVLPTGNPALMRAGRNPTPQQIKAIEGVLGLDKSLPTQFWDYIKNIFLHFDFGYSYGSQESVVAADQGTPAGDDLADRRGGGPVDRVRDGDRHPLGAAPPLRHRPRVDGRRAAARLGAGILARAGAAVPVLLGHRQVQDPARRGQLRGHHLRPLEMVHLAVDAVVRARGGQHGGVRAPDPRQPARGDGRGLHPHRARQGPARETGRADRECGPRSTRSSP